MPNLGITSCRGGMNNTDAAIAIAEDQCVLAENVEWTDSLLAERRQGTQAITLPPSLAGHERATFVARHRPTPNMADAELWVLGITGTSSATLARKTSAWFDVAIPDEPVLTGEGPYRWQALSANGKLHLAYPSRVNRLHVWDGTTLRRHGIAAPGEGPRAVDEGSGTPKLTGTRYGRVRWVRLAGHTDDATLQPTEVLGRSEPGPVTEFHPSTTADHIRWFRPDLGGQEYAELVARDGAVAHWRLGEPSGTVARDAIGTYHGTIAGTVGYSVPGALGDGSTGMAFNATGHVALPPIKMAVEFTLEAWVKLPVGPWPNPKAIFSNRQLPDTTPGPVQLGIGGGAMFAQATLPGQTPNIGIEGGPALNDNLWHHVVVTHTGATATLYVDGVQVAQQAQTHISTTAETSAAIGIEIGLGDANAWPGSIDEVAVYPTALSAAQVANHHSASDLPWDGATHWELELSTDGTLFYRVARLEIDTLSWLDNVQAPSPGYADLGVLSEDIGDYTLAWSARYLTVDENKLLWAGSFLDDELASTVGWGPAFNDPVGVGNDERLEADTDPMLHLDTTNRGGITGLSAPVLGAIWVTKQAAIYRLQRSGKRSKAYEADKFSDTLGGLHGALISGLDEQGRPCLYGLDADEGPYRIGLGGIMRCGEDVRRTWERLNVNANAVAVSALYIPNKRQACWNLATDGSHTPNLRIILHVDLARSGPDGMRRGWAIWTGAPAKALSMTLHADNIEAGGPRSSRLVPFLGLIGDGLVHRGQIGHTDNGTPYHATLRTKPLWLESPLHHCEIRAAQLTAEASAGGAVQVSLVRDFGLETTTTIPSVPLTPIGSERDVIRPLDQFVGAEMRMFQVQLDDVAAPTAAWAANRFDAKVEKGQEV